jgi:hypothetical protein
MVGTVNQDVMLPERIVPDVSRFHMELGEREQPAPHAVDYQTSSDNVSLATRKLDRRMTAIYLREIAVLDHNVRTAIERERTTPTRLIGPFALGEVNVMAVAV